MNNLILTYSDVHLKDCGSFPPFNQISNNGLTKELNNKVAGLRFVADKIRELKPLVVVNAGDTFHNTEFQPAGVLHAAHIGLSMIKEACKEAGCEHFIINGNHDNFNENCGISNISSLTGYGHIILQEEQIHFNGKRITLLPWSSNINNLYVRLTDLENSTELIITHLDFNDCKYENGHKSESNINSDWNITILSGDIHLAQSYKNIHYIGSLVRDKFYKPNFDGVGGVLTHDLDTKKLQRYQNTYSKHYVKIIHNQNPLTLVDPNHAVLQVFSDKNKDEISEFYKDYEWYYIRQVISEEKKEYSNITNLDPNELLLNHVKQDNPDAVETLTTILGSR